MKKILVGLLVIGSISAFAHPGDTELMTMIDIGSKLRIQKDINIPSHNQIILKDGAIYTKAEALGKKVPGCRVSAYDRNGKDFHKDVVVRSGQSLTLDSRDFYPGGEVLQFKTAKKTTLELFCWNTKSEKDAEKTPTISQFKKVLGENASIELSSPVEL